MRNMKWIILSVGAALAAAGIFWLVNEKLEERVPIRLGINLWPGYEYLQLAEEKGYFKEENVPIRLIRFSSLEDVRRAYERQQLDGMATTLIEILQAREHGAPAKIVIITDFSNGADVIIARKGITSVAELKDKTVGIEPATLSAFILARAVEKAGLSPEDVKMEGMNPLNMEEALLSGKVDAVHAYPPASLAMLEKIDGVTQIFDSSQLPKEIVDIVSVNPELIANRSDDIKALRRALEKAHIFAEEHPDEAYRIMAGYENISAGEFAEALKGIKILRFAEQEALMRDPALLQTITQVGDVLRKGGELKEPVDPSVFLTDAEETR